MKYLSIMVVVLVAAACSTAPSPTAPLPCRSTTYQGQTLPDPNCTPGVVNPNATLAKICTPGWTATIRPPASYTTALKQRQIVQYGYTDMRLSDYEEDHLISLELGGAPRDPRNLWPEPGASPNAKDRVENALHAAVCSGRLSLSAAQRAISSNWVTAAGLVH